MKIKRWLVILFTIVNVILYLTLTGLWISLPGELTLNISVTVFNLCLTTVLLIIERRQFTQFYQSNKFQHLVATIISAVLIFAILGVANYLSFKHFIQWDWSFYLASFTITLT
ncbi:MAG: hypothetical protein WCG27_11435 [Pseudomonadota bacterium]